MQVELFTYRTLQKKERLNFAAYLCGMTVISLRVAMRSSNGGCVLNSDDMELIPNIGFTMHSDDVEGEIACVGILLL